MTNKMNKFIAQDIDAWNFKNMEIRASFNEKAVHETLDSVFNES